MKVIDLEEARANLEHYANECQSSPVIVMAGGKLAFEMIPIRSDDPEFIDQLLAENEAFRHLLEARHQECTSGRTSSLEAVRQRLKGPLP